jgi:NitT/TauT family transport system substrate-binding protein
MPRRSALFTGHRSLATLFLCALLVACAPATAHAAKLEKFTVGLVNWIGYTGLFVGIDKGYFAAEGLEIEPKVFSAPGDGIPPVMNGSLDIHFTTLDVVIKAADKDPDAIKIPFLVDASRGADAFVAKNEYASVKDLKGKKVAVTIGECNELLLLSALSSAGMKEEDLDIVNMNPDDAGTAFASGSVDAAVTWEPWITKATSAGQGHVIFSSKDAPYVIIDVLAISPKYGKQKEIEGFLRGMVKAQDYIAAHPDDAAVIAGKAFEQTPAEAAAMLTKVKLFSKAENFSELGTPESPGPMIPATQALIDFFLGRKVIDKPLRPWSLFDMADLKK